MKSNVIVLPYESATSRTPSCLSALLTSPRSLLYQYGRLYLTKSIMCSSCTLAMTFPWVPQKQAAFGSLINHHKLHSYHQGEPNKTGLNQYKFFFCLKKLKSLDAFPRDGKPMKAPCARVVDVFSTRIRYSLAVGGHMAWPLSITSTSHFAFWHLQLLKIS